MYQTFQEVALKELFKILLFWSTIEIQGKKRLKIQTKAQTIVIHLERFKLKICKFIFFKKLREIFFKFLFLDFIIYFLENNLNFF